MKPEPEANNPQRESALPSATLLADMQRCLLWMEHVNRCAEREEKMGHWLSNWSEAMQHWDAEYQKARDAYMSANDQAQARRAESVDCK